MQVTLELTNGTYEFNPDGDPSVVTRLLDALKEGLWGQFPIKITIEDPAYNQYEGEHDITNVHQLVEFIGNHHNWLGLGQYQQNKRPDPWDLSLFGTSDGIIKGQFIKGFNPHSPIDRTKLQTIRLLLWGVESCESDQLSHLSLCGPLLGMEFIHWNVWLRWLDNDSFNFEPGSDRLIKYHRDYDVISVKLPTHEDSDEDGNIWIARDYEDFENPFEQIFYNDELGLYKHLYYVGI